MISKLLIIALFITHSLSMNSLARQHLSVIAGLASVPETDNSTPKICETGEQMVFDRLFNKCEELSGMIEFRLCSEKLCKAHQHCLKLEVCDELLLEEYQMAVKACLYIDDKLNSDCIIGYRERFIQCKSKFNPFKEYKIYSNESSAKHSLVEAAKEEEKKKQEAKKPTKVEGLKTEKAKEASSEEKKTDNAKPASPPNPCPDSMLKEYKSAYKTCEKERSGLKKKICKVKANKEFTKCPIQQTFKCKSEKTIRYYKKKMARSVKRKSKRRYKKYLKRYLRFRKSSERVNPECDFPTFAPEIDFSK